MTKWLLAAGVLMPLYSAQATQDPEAVYNRVCGACHSPHLPIEPQKLHKEACTAGIYLGRKTLVQRET
ncbi:cytochrome c5 family protein, partial [Pseudomonas sp. NPDC086251]|uniref:cytochrome c5 family protein n=1 Tax=Pseudomonas sp. NPDC086251 TaxID=3364431 RepID=UPI003834F272